MSTKKQYDRTFKENAVQLSYQREDLSLLAQELGIRLKLLYTWRGEYRRRGKESFPGHGQKAVTEEGKAQEHLVKENERLQKENEILKKALGIISRG